ncbi:MAG TPA: efflux RND transporter periplasmic adaptor subunit [Caulobacterales bacterium]|nr:efflux RND transporter periplasmic adaptor subunit [Caulobacterales bacterium]
MRRALILSLLLLAGACAKRESDVMQGYGEADYIYLASQEAGVVRELSVNEGDQVERGALIFRLDPDRLQLNAQSASESRNALAQAVRAAEANAQLTQRNFDRSQQLFAQGFQSHARLDADRAARDQAAAQLAEARRQLTASGAESGLAQVRLGDLSASAPLAGRIERIFHRQGEVVAAGAPIATLLAPQNMKVRFFAPENLVARLRPGARVLISCDGCAANLSGRVIRVADEPQFTPPVIYSLEQRQKLVFLVEARPDQPDAIRPGLPVDVRIAP